MAEEAKDKTRSDAINVSERERAEQALLESERRYRNLVENAHDMIYSHDLNGNYTSINNAGEQITGYTREEYRKLNVSQTVAPEYLDRANEMLHRKLAGERVPPFEMELIAKDGRRIAVEANTEIIFQEGMPIGVQGIARDVTDRKQLEDQLRQSQKMEAIGQLAGGVAHDFNNLLTAINGYSALALRRLGDDHPISSYLEEIKKAGDHAANLTRQLLAFGRKQILQPLPINLNEVVTDMSKMLRRLIGEDIQLTAKLDPTVRAIKADRSQIEQVLVNLIVNARDAMPRGGDLTIETKNVELDQAYANSHVGVSPGIYVMLEVTDTGLGMDEQTMDRIFEPFFTTKEKGKGTGLGLSTVYGIVKQTGGYIWVYSELSRGTTFKVYLPQSEDEARKIEKEESTITGGSETILLVEDEEVVRSLSRRILEQAGYHVLEAAGGEQALELCKRSEPIDLLLTDVVMPGISGKEVADRLCELYPQLSVLFMSGYTDEAIVHHGILDSNVNFIQKPFTPKQLAWTVRRELDNNEKRPNKPIQVRKATAKSKGVGPSVYAGTQKSTAGQDESARDIGRANKSVLPSVSPRVLIVDDETDVLGILEDFLHEIGCVTLAVSSGLEAIELAREFCPDIILVDYFMPRMNGIQTVQSLRSVVPSAVPIMITAHEQASIPTEALKESVFDFLSKPVELKDLRLSITRAMSYLDSQTRNRRQTDFLSIVSHQLRAPLQAPLNYLGNFLSGTYGQLEPEQKDRIKRIAKGIRTEIQLINNFLDLSYLEFGRFQIRRSLCSLRDLVHDVIDSFEMLAADAGVELQCCATEDGFAVHIDGEHITQAISNLLANAIQHSPSGSAIKFTLVREPSDVRVAISDGGPGIPSPYLERIFEKSFQVPSTTTAKGLGIGLYIASEIARAHNGRITVESKLGNGATFTLVLPHESN